MTSLRAAAIFAGCILFIGAACSSEPENQYPQGLNQQQMQQQMQQAMQQAMQQPAQPVPGMVPGQVPGQPVMPGVIPGQPPVAPAAVPSPATVPGVPAGQPANPLGALLGGLAGLGGQPGQQPAGGVQMVGWQQLSQALPAGAPGWTPKGDAKGESVNMMGIAVSTASRQYTQGAMAAKIEIVDTSMNPMMAMPFNMARGIQINSSEERMGPINFGTYPGTQNWNKQSNRAQVMVMVHNRVMITVEVNDAGSEQPAVQLGQHVNYAHIASLIGG